MPETSRRIVRRRPISAVPDTVTLPVAIETQSSIELALDQDQDAHEVVEDDGRPAMATSARSSPSARMTEVRFRRVRTTTTITTTTRARGASRPGPRPWPGACAATMPVHVLRSPCRTRSAAPDRGRTRRKTRSASEDAPEDERQRVGLEESDDLVGVHATWSTVAVAAGTTLFSPARRCPTARGWWTRSRHRPGW